MKPGQDWQAVSCVGVQGMEGSPGPGHCGEVRQAGVPGELLGAHTHCPQWLQILQVVSLRQPVAPFVFKVTVYFAHI